MHPSTRPKGLAVLLCSIRDFMQKTTIRIDAITRVRNDLTSGDFFCDLVHSYRRCCHHAHNERILRERAHCDGWPLLRGSIHIKSPVPGSEPAIGPNFLSAETDRDCAVAGMQIGRKIMNHPAIAKYIAFENRPGDKVRSYDEWLDYARRTGRGHGHLSALAEWVMIGWRWSMTGCGCTALQAGA